MAFLDLEHDDTPATLRADIAIVGAGAVGIAMAAELARSGRRVLLLEAGGASLERSSQEIFAGARSSGVELEGLRSGRFRLLGGTTNFWGGQLVPFDPIVFEDRPWVPAPAWPIGLETLRHYYARAMSLVGMDGSLADDRDVWARAGIEPPDLGDDLLPFLTRWARTPNFAKLFKPELAGPNVQVVLHANVTGLEPDESGRRVARIHLRTFGGRRAVVDAGTTILACGTVEISRLLLLRYADGRETPWSANPWLGRGYIDHLDSTAAEVAPIDRDRFVRLFENMFFDRYKYNPKIKLTEPAQRARGLLGCAGSFQFKTSYAEHAEVVKLFLRSVRDGRMPKDVRKMPRHVVALSRVAIPFALRYLRESRAFHPSDASVLFRVTVEQIPRRDSRITLGTETDALGMPTVDVHWAVDGAEIETIAQFAEEVGARLRQAGLAELAIDPLLQARDPAYLRTASDTYHQMGGARMGRDASDGVVDTDGRVFGVDGLYVAGAATFPSTGFANCTLTAITLGLRLCDHLGQDRVAYDRVA